MITVEEAKKEIMKLCDELPPMGVGDQLEDILWELIKSHRLLECPNCQCSLEGYFKE